MVTPITGNALRPRDERKWLTAPQTLVILMSALGHKRTFTLQKVMSALPPKADIGAAQINVCYGPIADGAASIEQRVGALQKRFWNCEPYGLRSLEIDDQLELRRLLNR